MSRAVVVGVVERLWRYPVKSMSADELDCVEVSWAGLAGDRRWAFVRPDSEQSGFPWHTIREHSELAGYATRFVDPERPDRSIVEVQAPTGEWHRITDPELVRHVGDGTRVMRLDKGTFDAMPVSVITTHTTAAICALADVPDDALRFRPNFLIRPLADEPYVEDEWVGSVLQIGGAQVRVDRRDSRCTIVDVDPSTGQQTGRVLKTIGSHRRAALGVYGTVVDPGRVALGDEVSLLA